MEEIQDRTTAEVPSSEELDVEGPNESAPGSNPDEESQSEEFGGVSEEDVEELAEQPGGGEEDLGQA
jgi:hypothetical protein